MSKSLPEQMGFDKSSLSFDQKMPTLMSFRNEWKLYKRKCDFTGESILSAYNPDGPFTVYKNSVWWGDDWDPMSYGKTFDFNRPFFEQFRELQLKVPREGTSVFNSQNCDYNGHIRDSKNCYLNSLVAKCEDTHYSYWMVNDKDCIDCMNTNNSTLCYECIDAENCYGCVFCQDVKDCSDCLFSFQLMNCKNCIFCTNLMNKEYCIDNKQVSKEEFQKVKAHVLEDLKGSRAKFLNMKLGAVHKAVHNINCENVEGDHFLNSRNSKNVFDGNDSEDIVDSISLADSKDVDSCYSAGWPRCERIYFSGVSRGCSDVAFSFYSWFSSGLRYCDAMNASHDCFGSIGLRHKKNCILNKQYSEEDYKDMMNKIVVHMRETGELGKFLPVKYSPFAYNETVAMDYYPLTKEQAPSWYDHDSAVIQVGDACVCEVTGKPFKLIPAEVEFYKKMSLPFPNVHPTQRYKDRLSLRNPRHLWDRKCDKCEVDLMSSYAPNRPEKIYCHACYLKEVY